MRYTCAALSLLLAAAPSLHSEEKPAYTFGTTVVNSSGLQGRVFHLDPDTRKLPNLSRRAPVGSVYTTTLNIWPQDFAEGFPGLTDRYEWFAIAYTARIWIETPGTYRFSLMADDGARLKLNGKLVVDNDGVHQAQALSASATLSRGVHELELDYFQGPRFAVALVLAVAPPAGAWRIFDMEDFKPPKDPEQWVKGRISEIRRQRLY